MKKIAIIDPVNHDIGLNILFKDADYYVKEKKNKEKSFQKYDIIPKYNWETINDKNYDYLFIILALYDTLSHTKFYKLNINKYYNEIINIIKKNNFKKVILFDNYDYDYDPSLITKDLKIDIFFKRNYNKNKIYNKNVYSFPFIMFGDYSIIEKLESKKQNNKQLHKNNNIFFAGGLYQHVDPQYNIIRDRITIFNNIKKYIDYSNRLPYNKYMFKLQNSKYCLDLLGVGEPNKRTFEILANGSLLIQQKNNLKWPFKETFAKETFFKDENDFIIKINNLNNDNNLYDKCLNQQNLIFNKYMNKEWIRNYIINCILE